MKEIAIDSKFLLSLHSSNEKKRISVKNFLVEKIRKNKKLYMSFEDVGKCDDHIWKFHKSKRKQDNYWPFIDLLQTKFILRGKKNKKAKLKIKIGEKELKFPKELEELYKKSLKLKIS